MVAGLVEWCLGIKGMVDGDVVERCQMKDRKQVWSVGSCPFKRGLHRNSNDNTTTDFPLLRLNYTSRTNSPVYLLHSLILRYI